MKTLIYIILFLLAVIIFTLVWLIREQLKSLRSSKSTSSNSTASYTPGWKVYSGLIVAGIFSIASLFAPVILTQKAHSSDLNFAETGQIGDTIGGITSPFLGIAGIILTFLAFYMQYKANQLQREQFLEEQEGNKQDLQDQIDRQNKQIQVAQFESQFYEMLKLHRANINEMQITGYDFIETDTILNRFEKITEGRKVFVVMQTELEVILSIYKIYNGILEKKGFEKCYDIFFGGLEEYIRKHPGESKSDFIKALQSARNQHEFPDHLKHRDNKSRKVYNGVELYFNYKPFSGHASRLGHYFRHLYLSVKSVASSTILNEYVDKMKYLAILRAQLSNHEQILLFYNWLSGYGGKWENKNHAFLTDYKMLHNLWYDRLLKDAFIEEMVDFLRKKPTKFRTGKMYEID